MKGLFSCALTSSLEIESVVEEALKKKKEKERENTRGHGQGTEPRRNA